MEKLKSTDLHSMEKFHPFVYDDPTTGSGYVESAYEFYIKGKPRLAEANFKLMKFESNSRELGKRIKEKLQKSSQCSDADTNRCS